MKEKRKRKEEEEDKDRRRKRELKSVHEFGQSFTHSPKESLGVIPFPFLNLFMIIYFRLSVQYFVSDSLASNLLTIIIYISLKKEK